MNFNATFKDEENQMAEDEAENSGSNKIVFSFLQAWSFQTDLSCILHDVGYCKHLKNMSIFCLVVLNGDPSERF